MCTNTIPSEGRWVSSRNMFSKCEEYVNNFKPEGIFKIIYFFCRTFLGFCCSVLYFFISHMCGAIFFNTYECFYFYFGMLILLDFRYIVVEALKFSCIVARTFVIFFVLSLFHNFNSFTFQIDSITFCNN